ncbi:MAG: hypothetical protein LBM00_07895 [Deltaproteobacteria bacterium]|jgi:hypothetical protein|nr:hypothetical protein [Deltaproteobacteria bacterium]
MLNINLDSRPETIFWFSDFSRMLNFGSAPVENRVELPVRENEHPHPDVYYHTRFIPYVTVR